MTPFVSLRNAIIVGQPRVGKFKSGNLLLEFFFILNVKPYQGQNSIEFKDSGTGLDIQICKHK